MDALVEKTQPDLITLPGDNLSAMSSRFSINNFIKHMESYGIPWAPVFGNHDNEIPSNTLNWQADKYMAAEHCLMQKGPSNLYGCGNYVINITEKGEPIYTLFMFDNGRYLEYLDEETNEPYTKEIYMGYEQIAWYEWNVKGKNSMPITVNATARNTHTAIFISLIIFAFLDISFSPLKLFLIFKSCRKFKTVLLIKNKSFVQIIAPTKWIIYNNTMYYSLYQIPA